MVTNLGKGYGGKFVPGEVAVFALLALTLALEDAGGCGRGQTQAVTHQQYDAAGLGDGAGGVDWRVTETLM